MARCRLFTWRYCRPCAAIETAKIPHTLHNSFPEASNVLHMWSEHFTVEADVIT